MKSIKNMFIGLLFVQMVAQNSFIININIVPNILFAFSTKNRDFITTFMRNF